MNNEKNKEYVRQNFLDEAILSIKINRRYWNGSISRTLASILCELLDEVGLAVFAWEISPQWEHVFYLQSDIDKQEEIKVIAQKRYELMRNESNKQDLPI